MVLLSLDRWQGKVAVVTGASSGIGASIAQRLVEEGLQVVGFARRVNRIEELGKKLSGKKGKLYAIKADLTKEGDILKAFDWIKKNLGCVHVLINNAGVSILGSLITSTKENWKKSLDLNVIGLSICTREAIKMMQEKQIVDGHIFHINSIFGHPVFGQGPGANMYAASKYAVTALTKTLREDLIAIESQIKITSISPGFVKTEMMSNLRKDCPKEVLVEQLTQVKHPILEPEDIVEGIVYALSTPSHVDQVHQLSVRQV